MKVDLEQINSMIYVIREQKVMLDSDLANLYGVETKRLNEQVRRNVDRFPDDFMFKLTKSEFESLRSQFATSKEEKGGRRYQPLVFTENGVAMLSTVLSSKQAIKINISIMRIFTKLRSFYALEERMDKKVNELELNVTQVFKVVFERLDKVEKIDESLVKNRKKIGLKNKD